MTGLTLAELHDYSAQWLVYTNALHYLQPTDPWAIAIANTRTGLVDTLGQRGWYVHVSSTREKMTLDTVQGRVNRMASAEQLSEKSVNHAKNLLLWREQREKRNT